MKNILKMKRGVPSVYLVQNKKKKKKRQSFHLQQLQLKVSETEMQLCLAQSKLSNILKWKNTERIY